MRRGSFFVQESPTNRSMSFGRWVGWLVGAGDLPLLKHELLLESSVTCKISCSFPYIVIFYTHLLVGGVARA